jgi:IclR family KDG regulon transcriptional repressor
MQDNISRRYYIGPLITEIASNPYVTHEHLVSCAFNEMRSLSDITCETVGLGVLVGLKNILLHEIPSSYDLQIIAKKKISSQIHAGSSGKVLLSQLRNKDLKIVMNNLTLEPVTELTVTDREQLMAQLKQIRRQGYSVTYGERISGGISVSVPIKNYILPASINILGPENRVKPRIAEFTGILLDAGASIEQKLSRIFNKKNNSF